MASRNSSSSKTGGLDPMEEYVIAESQQDAAGMARAFLKTCPWDWNRGWGINTRGCLLRLIRGEKPSEDICAVAMMRFRWETAQYAEDLIARFGLPIPDGQRCLMWDEYYSDAERRRKILDYSTNYCSALRFISKEPIFLPESIDSREDSWGLQGHPFNRPPKYLAAAIALADYSPEEQAQLLERMRDSVLKDQKVWARPIVRIASKKRGISEVDESA